MPLQTLKGFRDFIGNEATSRARLIEIFRHVFTQEGFEPLETPALEYEELLLGKYGDEANKLIYGFTDRGDRRVALRYDQTVPTARVYAQYRHLLPRPYKRFQIQPVWRADKPQKGRYREFYQCDIDIIGSKSPIADATLLATIHKALVAIGLPQYHIKINDRQSLITHILSSGIADTDVFSVIQTIDKLDKKTRDEVCIELGTKGCTPEQTEKILHALETSTPSVSLVQIQQIAQSMGVPESCFLYTPTLARGLDYYTGMIIEVVLDAYPNGSICGGGRYDNLIGGLVGIDAPATGVAFGFDRLLDAIQTIGVNHHISDQDKKLLIVPLEISFVQKALQYAAQYEKKGYLVEIYPGDSIKKQHIKMYAKAKNINLFALVGQRELQDIPELYIEHA